MDEMHFALVKRHKGVARSANHLDERLFTIRIQQLSRTLSFLEACHGNQILIFVRLCISISEYQSYVGAHI